MAEFDRNPYRIVDAGQEIIQSGIVIAKERRELDQKHPEIFPEVPQIVSDPFKPTFGLEESFIVSEKPRCFDAHQET